MTMTLFSMRSQSNKQAESLDNSSTTYSCSEATGSSSTTATGVGSTLLNSSNSNANTGSSKPPITGIKKVLPKTKEKRNNDPQQQEQQEQEQAHGYPGYPSMMPMAPGQPMMFMMPIPSGMMSGCYGCQGGNNSGGGCCRTTTSHHKRHHSEDGTTTTEINDSFESGDSSADNVVIMCSNPCYYNEGSMTTFLSDTGTFIGDTIQSFVGGVKGGWNGALDYGDNLCNADAANPATGTGTTVNSNGTNKAIMDGMIATTPHPQSPQSQQILSEKMDELLRMLKEKEESSTAVVGGATPAKMEKHTTDKTSSAAADEPQVAKEEKQPTTKPCNTFLSMIKNMNPLKNHLNESAIISSSKDHSEIIGIGMVPTFSEDLDDDDAAVATAVANGKGTLVVAATSEPAKSFDAKESSSSSNNETAKTTTKPRAVNDALANNDTSKNNNLLNRDTTTTLRQEENDTEELSFEVSISGEEHHHHDDDESVEEEAESEVVVVVVAVNTKDQEVSGNTTVDDDAVTYNDSITKEAHDDDTKVDTNKQLPARISAIKPPLGPTKNVTKARTRRGQRMKKMLNEIKIAAPSSNNNNDNNKPNTKQQKQPTSRAVKITVEDGSTKHKKTNAEKVGTVHNQREHVDHPPPPFVADFASNVALDSMGFPVSSPSSSSQPTNENAAAAVVDNDTLLSDKKDIVIIDQAVSSWESNFFSTDNPFSSAPDEEKKEEATDNGNGSSFSSAEPGGGDGWANNTIKNPETANMIVCAWCRKGGGTNNDHPEFVKTLKLCSACQSTYYCSLECQSRDWINGHATTCVVKE